MDEIDNEPKLSDRLPPLFVGVKDGAASWKTIESINYELLGVFLSCHLVVEHYLDEYFKLMWPQLHWDGVELRFEQKISLLTGITLARGYDVIPVLKHMNKIRNRFGHNLTYVPTDEDWLPFRNYLKQCYKQGGATYEPPTEKMVVIKEFTSMACVIFASQIAGIIHTREH